MINNLFDNDDLRVQLANRMDISPEGFDPLHDVADDYKVLVWMRTTVRTKYVTTYGLYTSYISGAMHQYVVGDYTRGAMLAIGIIDSSKETGNK